MRVPSPSLVADGRAAALVGGARISEAFRIVATAKEATKLSVGTYTVRWRRCDASGRDPATAGASEQSAPLAMLLMETPPLSVTWGTLRAVGRARRTARPTTIAAAARRTATELPAFGVSNMPLDVSYTIINHSAVVQDVDTSVTPSDAFLLAGLAKAEARLMPGQTHTLRLRLHPLAAGGPCALPLVRIWSRRLDTELPVRRRKPTHIYIMPAAAAAHGAPT